MQRQCETIGTKEGLDIEKEGGGIILYMRLSPLSTLNALNKQKEKKMH
jgi:hypothetical protein